MRQYELWWADLPEPIGKRPVLILTRTPALRYLSRVIIAEVTTRVRGNAVEVPLGAAEGLPRPCVVNLDSVHAVPLRSLSGRIGALDSSRHVDVKRAVGHAFSWIDVTAP